MPVDNNPRISDTLQVLKGNYFYQSIYPSKSIYIHTHVYVYACVFAYIYVCVYDRFFLKKKSEIEMNHLVTQGLPLPPLSATHMCHDRLRVGGREIRLLL